MQGRFYKKRSVFLGTDLKVGLWVEFSEIEGLLCKYNDAVRPEAVAALLVGKDSVSLPAYSMC